jgi:uncharacterized protein YjbI with pentapeptide repeats
VEASLIKANLQDVDLQNADLKKTILFKAAVSKSALIEAQLCLTSLPDYTMYNRDCEQTGSTQALISLFSSNWLDFMVQQRMFHL